MGSLSACAWQLEPSEVGVLMTYKPAITSADKEKMARYEEYIRCLRTGVTMVSPTRLTEWQWEAERKLFDMHLPSDVLEA